MKRLLALLIVVVLVSAAQAYGHHSFAATYIEDKTAQIEGTLVQFLFRNPHSFVYVDARDENGEMQRWAVEWGGAGQLAGQGVTHESLKAGDVLTITGNPGRNPDDHRLRMVSLRRKSDNFGWPQRPSDKFN